MSEEKKEKNLFTPILVGLLIVAAFMVGSLYTKVQYMQDGKVKTEEKTVETAETKGTIAQPEIPQGPVAITPSVAGVTTFMEKKDAEIIREDGKPLVYLFSTTWCPHCTWVAETFDSVVTEYVNAGKIAAYHWELDTNDNTLTPAVETEVPAEHTAVYEEFNPGGSIPTFVIGGKYFRVGNGHESADDLVAEAAELRAAIDAVLQ